MKRTALFGLGGFAAGRIWGERGVQAVVIVGVVVVLLLGVVAVRRWRQLLDRQQRDADALASEARALRQLAADARRRPDYPKLPRI